MKSALCGRWKKKYSSPPVLNKIKGEKQSMSQKAPFKSGFVTIVGLPNVGKSSIMNALIGEKIAIVSSRPQTTRNRIMGVVTHENDQIVFLDTPGIHHPRTKLGEYMMQSVSTAMDGMDCVLMVADVTHIKDKDRELARNIASQKVPKILVLNKIDLVHPEKVLEITAEFADYSFNEIIPVSARNRSGLEDLTSSIVRFLPEGPKYFPDDMMTDQPERNICSEIIREKALRHLQDEVPHGIGVEIMGIKKISDSLTEIHATIYCEREAHKGIIIGRHGSMLQIIGSEARTDIEKLLGTHVNLQLWVKIRPDWRNNLSDLKTLGYENS
jgi:GTP-binding protein Era